MANYTLLVIFLDRDAGNVDAMRDSDSCVTGATVVPENK